MGKREFAALANRITYLTRDEMIVDGVVWSAGPTHDTRWVIPADDPGTAVLVHIGGYGPPQQSRMPAGDNWREHVARANRLNLTAAVVAELLPPYTTLNWQRRILHLADCESINPDHRIQPFTVAAAIRAALAGPDTARVSLHRTRGGEPARPTFCPDCLGPQEGPTQ